MRTLKHLLLGNPGGGSPAAGVGLLILRLFAGLHLAFGHGLGKFPPPEGFVAGVGRMGFPAPHVFAWAASGAEFIGALLLVLGLLTRPAAFLVACTMLVAVLTVHRQDPLFMQDAATIRTERTDEATGQTVVTEGKGGTKEPALLFLAPALALMLTGAGRFGVDTLFWRDRGRRQLRADDLGAGY